jgi:hypothetical protein
MDAQVYLRTLDFLEKFAPAVVLPIMVVWLSNRMTRKQKALDQDFEIRKIKESKSFETEHQQDIMKRDHERVVHSSLIKVLFQVQRLHIALSGSCVDLKCIDEAVIKFNEGLDFHQNIISENQIFIPASTVNKLYQFYSVLADLLIELRELRDEKKFELAIVPVYECSHYLADVVIDVQNDFVRKRKDLTEELNALEVPYFRACCGQEPPEELKKQISEIRKRKQEVEQALVTIPTTESYIEIN